MKRRMTIEEAMQFGASLPVGLSYSKVTGKPLVSRADWERLPRRWSDEPDGRGARD